MNQPERLEGNLPSTPQPSIWQQADRSTLGSGMQAARGDGNIQIQGDSNVVTFNQTKILQISVEEIKTHEFIVTSPYKGLKEFEIEDKELFFGRDQFLRDLVNELEQTNLILLLGASGSGKSSVVRAGLVSWLLEKWRPQLVTLIFTPDSDPFESFYATLLGKYKQAEAQIAREAKANTLTDIVTRLKQPDDYWFIFIDQFEELFTTSDADKRDQFIASLVKLSKTKQRSVKIIATMRADFLDRLSPYPQLVKATEKHRPMIAEMQPDELRLAIEQPAAHHGVVFETGLVEELIKDIQGQAGYLPLLQYSLNLLWETEVKTGSINKRTLNISTYRQLGGVRGALQQHVALIYSVLPEREQLVTQRIFLKLVGIGGDEKSDTEWKPVRRRALRSEFGDELEQSVLVKLINENLLVSDRQPQSQESTVEIAHEVLLTSWTTLNTWIKDNRQAITLRNRLNEDVARWQAKKTEDELWTGSKLEQVLELRKDPTFNQVLGGFSETANQFIDASVGVRDRQRRRTIIGLTSFSTVALMFASFAVWQWQSAVINETNAHSLYSAALLASNQELDALIESLRAGKKLKQTIWAGVNIRNQVVKTLQMAADRVKERNRLEGDQNSVNQMVFSPDGQHLATSGYDGSARLWDLKGQQLAEFKGHQGSVDEVVFSPDGQHLATRGNGSARLWDLKGQQLAVLKGHQGSVDEVVFSPDDQHLATRGNGSARLWDLKGQQLAEFKDHQGSVDEVIFSPNGQHLATSGDDVTARLWDLKGQQLAEFKGEQGSVYSVVFSPDGLHLATRGNGTARLWDLKGQQLAEFKDHQGSVDEVIFSPDGQHLATSGDDVTPRLWDLKGQQLAEFKGEQGSVYSVVFSPDGLHLATSRVDRGEDDTIHLWDLKGQQLAVLKGHQGDIWSVLFSPDGQRLATSGEDGTTRLWNLKGQQLAEFKGEQGSLYEVVFSPNGQQLAIGGYDGTIRLWDLSDKQLAVLKGGDQNSVSQMVFSPDDQHLATSGYDGSARLWDLKSQQLAVLKGHQGSVYSVVFSPDGQHLATSGYDGSARLWDLKSQQLAVLKGHQGSVYSVVFSPDGQHLATGGGDGSTRLWDLKGQQLAEFKGHQGSVYSVVFSPDGQHLATRGDGSTRLWDLKGQQLAEFKGHQGSVYSVVFSPDGQHLATGGDDGTARLWDLKGQQLAVLKGDQIEVNGVLFSPDGQHLVTINSEAGNIRLWKLSDLQLVELNGVQAEIHKPIFSPNGKYLATLATHAEGPTYGTAHLWDLKGQQLAVLKGDQNEVNGVVFSPDGQRLATSGDDGTARLWDLRGQQLAEFKDEQGSIYSVVFSPYGQRLATVGEGGTVKLWQIEGLDELMVRGCNWVRDYLKNNPKVSKSDRHLCDGIGIQK